VSLPINFYAADRLIILRALQSVKILHQKVRNRMATRNDNRNDLPRFKPEAIAVNLRMVKVLNSLGLTDGVTAAQGAPA
jgi:hypothetical protein